jgi:hypothetical protein
MIKKCFDDILVNENNGCSVYINNNKNFDSIFILKALLGSDIKVKPLFKDGKMISITLTKLKVTKKSVRLILKDSYMLLPSSLRKLADSYGVGTSKGVFPYTFPNGNNLEYVGPRFWTVHVMSKNASGPDYRFFDKRDIDINGYNSLVQ